MVNGAYDMALGIMTASFLKTGSKRRERTSTQSS